MHYYLTYYLALNSGCFSAADAKAVASGNQDTDDNINTRPGFGGNRPVADPRPNYRQQQANIDYHAFHGGDHQPFLDMHWKKATLGTGGDLGGMGIYLHYLQDMFSHFGYTDPLYGHSPAHGGNHADDKTDEDVEKAIGMARATLDALKRFAMQTGRKCECADTVSWATVQKFAEAPGGNFITRRSHSIEDVNPWYLNNKIQILGLTRR